MNAKRKWTAGVLAVFLSIALMTAAASGATHLVPKIAGNVVALPAYADGDTLAITGDAPLEAGDWEALRHLQDEGQGFHLLLNAATAAIPAYGMNYAMNLLSIAGSGVTDVGNDAFNYASALRSATFPAATRIGERAFYSCSALAGATFPMVESIEGLAFAMCRGLTKISFPAAKETGSHAFAYCSGLTEVSFPAMTDIGNEVFSNCPSLTGVSFPAATTIGSGAFRGCTSLGGASFPAAERVGSGAFGDCSSLEGLSLPSVKELEDYGLNGLKNLTVIELGPVPPSAGIELYEGSKENPLFLVPDGVSDAYAGWGDVQVFGREGDRLEDESGTIVLTLTGRLLQGRPETTGVESATFEFDDRSVRTAVLSPEPLLSELIGDDEDSSSGCSGPWMLQASPGFAFLPLLFALRRGFFRRDGGR